MGHATSMRLALPLACLCLLCFSTSSSADFSGKIKGRLYVPGPYLPQLPTAEVFLHTANGLESRTFTDSEGAFTFVGVPAGSHTVHVYVKGLVYPEVRLDVTERHGVMRATMPAIKQALPHSPLILKPIAEAQYYEKRKPIDVWSFFKSPMGIMIAISVVALVVIPMMKVDPEEYKEMQEMMKGRQDKQPQVRDK